MRDYVDQRLAGFHSPRLDLPTVKGQAVRLEPPAGATLHVDDDLPSKADAMVISAGTDHVIVLAPTRVRRR